MKLHRRAFLKTTLAASTAAAASATLVQAAEAEAHAGRELYELRAYRLSPGASSDALDGYFENALLPALTGRGIQNVGVFSEVDADKNAGTTRPKSDSPIWLLIPHPTFDSFLRAGSEINSDPTVQAAGAPYLDVPKSSPAFVRVDVWLYRAFKGMPHMELADFSKTRSATRIFEMRDYESHGEKAALNKMAMFDDGEISLMKDLGMSPLLFGEAIAGPNLPHLRYFTSGADVSAHFAAWDKFGPDPRWKSMASDPKYRDNTSKNTARFLVPRPYSQI